MKYLSRELQAKLKEYLKTFPAVMGIGPRQCGKSTLIANELAHYNRYDLERPADFDLITNDPELFLTEYSEPAGRTDVMSCSDRPAPH